MRWESLSNFVNESIDQFPVVFAHNANFPNSNDWRHQCTLLLHSANKISKNRMKLKRKSVNGISEAIILPENQWPIPFRRHTSAFDFLCCDQYQANSVWSFEIFVKSFVLTVASIHSTEIRHDFLIFQFLIRFFRQCCCQWPNWMNPSALHDDTHVCMFQCNQYTVCYDNNVAVNIQSSSQFDHKRS